MRKTPIVVVAAVIAAVAATAASGAGGGALVRTGPSGLGRILVDGSGRSLYLFEADRAGKSACNGACAKFWPPLLTSAKPRAGAGARGSLLGTIRRSDGRLQVTYHGHPLYRFVQDAKAGQAAGEGMNAFGASWYVLAPSGVKIDRDAATAGTNAPPATTTTTPSSGGYDPAPAGGYGY